MCIVYDHNIQTYSFLKPLGKSKPNFMWSIVRNMNDWSFTSLISIVDVFSLVSTSIIIESVEFGFCIKDSSVEFDLLRIHFNQFLSL